MPRPDTETVVELALEMLRATPRPDRRLRIADLGTGSGAILLALLSELPDAIGIGTDISVAALQTARDNAVDLGLAGRAGFVACDYAAALSGPFDLIVSNPPYIRSADIAGLATEVRDYDPPRALDGGADGLDAYRALIPQAARLLAPQGALVVEVGQGQARRCRGPDDGGWVNAGGACQGRSGGYPPGRRRPEKAVIKPDWKAKKPLGIFARERLRSGHNIGPGLLAPQIPRRDIAGGGQSSQSESPPRVKGSKTQVQLSAMAERAALLPTAKRTKA